MLISFEGGEGAGKTTLIERLKHRIEKEGFSVLKTREPGGTPLSEKIRSLLLDSKESIAPLAELALFLAARAQQVEKVIKPALAQNKVVLCDRFNDSSVAYQGYGRGLDPFLVASVADSLSSHLKPELTFYLDLDPQIGLMRASRRAKRDRIEKEEIPFHQAIRDGYLAICASDPHRCHRLDASLPIEQVEEKSWNILHAKLAKYTPI